VLLIFVSYRENMPARYHFFSKYRFMDSPVAFGFRLFDSSDHATVLARQKIANKAIGEFIDVNCRRSRIVDSILAKWPSSSDNAKPSRDLDRI
jgi:hypothetical protein